MRREKLGNETWFLLALRLQLFKHRGHGSGIVSGCLHVLNPELIGFFLSAAGELHEPEQTCEAAALVDQLSQIRRPR